MIKYGPIRAADISRIMELYAEHLNSGGDIEEIIGTSWKNGSYIGCTAKENGEIIGFLTVRMGIAFTYPHPELEAELAAFVQEKRVAMCDSLLVLPPYRNRGIAHRLAEQTRKLLLDMSFDYFLTEIWVYPDGNIPARGTFETMGTVRWQRQIDHFYEDLERYGMCCPVCGTHCVCGALVEILEIKE